MTGSVVCAHLQLTCVNNYSKGADFPASKYTHSPGSTYTLGILSQFQGKEGKQHKNNQDHTLPSDKIDSNIN